MLQVSRRIPNLAHRAIELDLLKIPGASHSFQSGRKLVYRFKLAPSEGSRLYTCELHVTPGEKSPEMIVVNPNLRILADGRRPPHTYTYKGRGTKLCLWAPRRSEWNWKMKLIDTYVPWTAEWLWYFEDWLQTGEWTGGGDHPDVNDRGN